MNLKNALMRFTAAVLCVSAFAAPALALSGTVNTGASRLNMRAQASTTGAVVTKLPGGAKVDIVNTLDGWYQISYGELTGYVSSQFVDLLPEEPAAQAAPAVEAPAEAAQAAPAETAALLTGRVVTSSLNVRTGPGTGYDKCGKLSAGKTVEILEQLDGWYRIAEGYVSADYILVCDPNATGSEKAMDMVELALSYVGSPYVYGGSSPKGFDCSGFTSYVARQFGIELSRSSSGQLDNGTPVAMSELQPGDLVIFKKYASSAKRASHVGMYIGDGQFVHSSTYGVGVIVSSLSEAYYTTGFVGGRRIV